MITQEEARQVVARLTTYEVIELWRALPQAPRPSMRQFGASVKKVRAIILAALTRVK